jgi:hypothetical protein
MVRAYQHAGDPAELRDSGNVPAVLGRQWLRLQQVQDIAGELQHLFVLVQQSHCVIQRDSLARDPKFFLKIELSKKKNLRTPRPFSASIISKSCFTPFPVCVYTC